jgi:hypothetical protein
MNESLSKFFLLMMFLNNLQIEIIVVAKKKPMKLYWYTASWASMKPVH